MRCDTLLQVVVACPGLLPLMMLTGQAQGQISSTSTAKHHHHLMMKGFDEGPETRGDSTPRSTPTTAPPTTSKAPCRRASRGTCGCTREGKSPLAEMSTHIVGSSAKHPHDVPPPSPIPTPQPLTTRKTPPPLANALSDQHGCSSTSNPSSLSKPLAQKRHRATSTAPPPS